MKILVDYQVIWSCNTVVEAEDHAEAAELVRLMGSAEHYDNCTKEETRVFNTIEIPEEEYRGCDYGLDETNEVNNGD